MRPKRARGRAIMPILAVLVLGTALTSEAIRGQVLTRPGGNPIQLPPPPPPVDSNSTLPRSGVQGGGAGPLTPSWTPPTSPVPKVRPQAAGPAAAAPAARAPRRLCEVAPGANGCRGSATPDGGGSDDPSCDCNRDLCRYEQAPGQTLTRRYCYKPG